MFKSSVWCLFVFKESIFFNSLVFSSGEHNSSLLNELHKVSKAADEHHKMAAKIKVRTMTGKIVTITLCAGPEGTTVEELKAKIQDQDGVPGKTTLNLTHNVHVFKTDIKMLHLQTLMLNSLHYH